MTRRGLHRARLGAWTPDELKAHLVGLVDDIADASPLDVALELLGGELEAFVLFGRLGHLDPPQEDGKMPIAVLRRASDDPEVDAKIREAAKRWIVDQEGQS